MPLTPESQARQRIDAQPVAAGGTIQSQRMRKHIAARPAIEPDDFGYSPFAQRGGLGRSTQLFGAQLPALPDELDATLAA